MKKKFKICAIMLIIIFIIIAIGNLGKKVEAATVNFLLTSQSNLVAGQNVEVIVKIADADKGISFIRGELEYDKNIFETIDDYWRPDDEGWSDDEDRVAEFYDNYPIQGMNGWAVQGYFPGTDQLSLYRSSATKKDEVLKVTFKVKQSVNANSTEVKFTGLEILAGDEEITSPTVGVTISKSGGGSTPTPTPGGSGGSTTPTPTPGSSGGSTTPTPTPGSSGGSTTPTPTPGSSGGSTTPTPTQSGSTYSFVDNTSNQTYTVGKDTSLTLKVKADYSKFNTLKIDGKEVAKGNYTTSSVNGNTVITLKKAYLDTLSVGAHTVTTSFTDGSANTNITIAKSGSSTGTTTQDGKDDGKTETTLPQTGENDVIIFSTMAVIIVGAVIAFKKYKDLDIR